MYGNVVIGKFETLPHPIVNGLAVEFRDGMIASEVFKKAKREGQKIQLMIPPDFGGDDEDIDFRM